MAGLCAGACIGGRKKRHRALGVALAVAAVAKDIILIAKVLTWAADLVYLHGHCMQYLCEEDHECWSKNVS